MRRTFRTTLISATLATFILVTLLYAGYRIYPLAVGPKITLYTPLEGDMVTYPTFQVSGKVERAKEIKIQGRPITISTDGVFNERLVSHYPYTILVIEAVDKYGKIKKEVLHIIPESSPLPNTQ